MSAPPLEDFSASSSSSSSLKLRAMDVGAECGGEAGMEGVGDRALADGGIRLTNSRTAAIVESDDYKATK